MTQQPVLDNPDSEATVRLVKQLYAHRRQCKISRTEVARRMNTSRGVVMRLEESTDRAGIQWSTVTRYARAVGAPISYTVPLVTGEVRISPASIPDQRTPSQR